MPIQILPPRLANQIAAGEVVERPASVVKELLENSLDAGATRIQIDIAKGGHQLIKIRDNGTGVAKEELTLALSRHATSKVSTLDDLEAITSMGFRGEALASISSVARLSFTSRTADQTEAWCAKAEGREMEVQLSPASHPQGTTVEVADLFFNTPARRRFLRTEKTEFTHIDEVVKRIALARKDVAITLTHNGKPVRQFRSGDSEAAISKRLQTVFGPSFLEGAIEVESVHHDMHLRGWIARPDSCRITNDYQYCYVNGRVMRDKLINHAIRQAYDERLGSDLHPVFLLYFDIDPRQVDVNVHPAKHEVRFHQSRLVHDYIYQVLHQALATSMQPELEQPSEAIPDTGLANSTVPGVSSAEGHSVAVAASYQNSYEPAPLRASESQPATGTGGYSSSYGASAGRGSHYGKPAVDSAAAAAYAELMHVPAEQRDVSSQIEPTPQNHEGSDSSNESDSRWLTLVKPHYLLLQEGEQLWLSNASRLLQTAHQAAIDQMLEAEVVSQPLLLPVSLVLSDLQLQAVQSHEAGLDKLGIKVAVKGHKLILRQIPARFRDCPWTQLLPVILDHLSAAESSAVETAMANGLQQCTNVGDLNELRKLCLPLAQGDISQYLTDRVQVDLSQSIKLLAKG
ncbi:DNA mismatch repair endonuclease MutL [Corallincola platygyrae]|uniref:DNA mismatch repair protein MutL n=1 Tax=Corallincola platygyrae TaxID=1193278 RepID=A0ABW4XND1_9GAMM